MAIPPNAKAFTRPMDPSDIADYQIDISQDASDDTFLLPGENVASYTLALTVEAIAAGLTIKTTGGYSTALVGLSVKFWLAIDVGSVGSSAFDGAGLVLAIELTVTTTAAPARVKQRTVTVNVANQ